MNQTTENLILAAKQLSEAERREVLVRLWAEDELNEAGKVWKSVRFGKNLKVVAYAPEQERFVGDLRELLLKGSLARIENEEEGTCEIYGADRTFYVTMSPKREFVALLSSWLPFEPPREFNLEEIG